MKSNARPAREDSARNFRILSGQLCLRITHEELDMNAHVQSIRAIFDEASEIADAEQRRAFVARACDDNEALRREVEELLAAHETAGGFLADPKRDESAALTLKEGDRIGRYKLLQKIGEGGCGVVFMAEQIEPVRRRVALKVIKARHGHAVGDRAF